MVHSCACLVSHSRARRLPQLAQYAATGAGMAPSVLHRTGNGTDGVALLAPGESVIKYKSPLNVLKDTYDYSC